LRNQKHLIAYGQKENIMDVKQLKEMPSNLASFSVMFAEMDEAQKTALENGERVFAWSKGHLPSVTPEGESVSFMLEEGAVVGTYYKSVRFGPDIEYTSKVEVGFRPRLALVSLDFAIAATVVADMAMEDPEVNTEDRKKMQEAADDARAKGIEQYLADYDAENGE